MLYIVGTPIGNLNDLSYRQAKTLSEAEIILTEDTRSIGILLQRITELFNFQINSEQKIISYYKEKEFEKLPQIIDWLEEGKEIALVSEAGMPVISDPGYLLVKTCVRKAIPYVVIPGPSAVTTALLYSGLSAKEFSFIGFLPKKEGDIRKLMGKIKDVKSLFPDMSFIAFESPNRIHETLQLIDEVLPDYDICIAREMTKMFEEVLRGKAHELMEREVKGEVTVVIS